MITIHHANARNIVSAGVVVPVSDLQRSHRWYADVLGLKMELDASGTSSCYAEEYEPGGSVTVLRLVAGISVGSAGRGVCMTFQVDRLEETVDSLKRAGAIIARAVSVQPGDALPSAAILDPDGHTIILYSW